MISFKDASIAANRTSAGKSQRRLKHSLLGISVALGITAALSPVGYAATSAGSAATSAPNGVVIQDIQVRGLNRVSLGAVLLALPVRQGDLLTPENVSLAMKRLYATGNFSNVSLQLSGNTLIVNVQERPTIGSITFAGNSQIQEDALRDVIEHQGLRAGEPINEQLLGQIEKSFEDFYHSAGMYQTDVKPVLPYLPRNRVAVKL